MFHSSCSSSYHPHQQGRRSTPLFTKPVISVTRCISKSDKGGMLTGSQALFAFFKLFKEPKIPGDFSGHYLNQLMRKSRKTAMWKKNRRWERNLSRVGGALHLRMPALRMHVMITSVSRAPIISLSHCTCC